MSDAAVTRGDWAKLAILRVLRKDLSPAVRGAIEALGADQTLAFENETFKVERSGPGAPRVIADRRLIDRPPADARALRAALGDLRGGLVFLIGYGDGALARAIREAGGLCFVTDVDAQALDGAKALTAVTTLDEAARETAAGRSVAMVANGVEVAELMVKRGFTPDFEIDAVGDRRIPVGYTAPAIRRLHELNPLELARTRLGTRDRFAVALRALTERGTTRLNRPADVRAIRLELGRDGSSAPAAWHREDRGALAAVRYAAAGAAYVDLGGLAIIVADADAIADATGGIKGWTSGTS